MTSFGTRDLEIQSAAGRTAQSEQWHHTKQEDAYLANEELSNASVGDTVAMLLENPADSGTSGVVAGAFGNPSAKSIIRIYDSFDGDPGGDPATVQNDLLDTGGEGEQDVGALNAATNVTYTPSGDPFASFIVGGSSTGRTSISGRAAFLPLIIEPDRRIVLEVEKLESDGDEVVISLDWFEVPIVFSETTPRFKSEELY